MSDEEIQPVTESRRVADLWWYAPPAAIWKFVVPLPEDLDDPVTVEVPGGYEPIHWDIDPASGHPAFWARIHPGAEREQIRFLFRMTGQKVQSTHVHEATLIKNDIVLHVFYYIPWARVLGAEGMKVPEGED
jgi:hypothetical protein